MKWSIISRKNSSALVLRASLFGTEPMSLEMYGESSMSQSLRKHGSITKRAISVLVHAMLVMPRTLRAAPAAPRTIGPIEHICVLFRQVATRRAKSS